MLNDWRQVEVTTVGTTFDSMGVLLKKKHIPVTMVPELMIIAISDFWSKVGPISADLARDMQRSNVFQNIEFLYNTVQKLNDTNGT
jgi:hypothetical protein